MSGAKRKVGNVSNSEHEALKLVIGLESGFEKALGFLIPLDFSFGFLSEEKVSL